MELRRAQSPIYEFSGFRLDSARRLLHTPDNQPAGLTVKAFDILLYLVEHRGDVVEKTVLLHAVWPNVIVEENNLTQNISVLRKALGERAGEHRFIVTVPGRGFRFVAPVKVGADEEAATPTKTPAPVTQTPAPRIAIMPLENLSPDPANAFFADGLHDEILATLAQRAPGLQVISRTTMMRYRASPAPLPSIAAELGANYVVEGTVRREADQVRVTLQLIDARDDKHLWSQTYDRTLKSALTLQGEVAGDVATRLAARFVGAAAVPPTNNPEAYDLYLRSRILGQRVLPGSPVEQFVEVDQLVSRAIALDAEFVAAYAHRIGFLSVMYAMNCDNGDEIVARIRADLVTAHRLAPEDPFVLAATAGFHVWVECDPARGLAAFQAAEAAGLVDSLSLASYSMLLDRMGRAKEGMELMERAVNIDPANPFLMMVAGIQYASLRRYADGIREIDRAIQMYPENRILRVVRAQVLFLHTGKYQDLCHELDSIAQQLPPATLIDLNFRVALARRNYDDLGRVLDAITEPDVRIVPGPGGAGPLFGAGRRPVAQYRGWLALFRGDAEEAARQGEVVLAFVARAKLTLANEWFLHLLAADGHTFQGNREKAIAAARTAIEVGRRIPDTFSAFVDFFASRILAWNGRHAEAMTLIEEISSAERDWGDALFTRDAILKAALAEDARYLALVERLEARMSSRTLL